MHGPAITKTLRATFLPLAPPQERLKMLAERRYELQAEEEKARMPPEEQREQLMAKIKRDNAEIERATQVRGVVVW